jgi:hypothetical protein
MNLAVDALLSLWLLSGSERRAQIAKDHFCCKRRVSFYIKLIKSRYLMLHYCTYALFYVVACVDNSPETESRFVGRTAGLISIQSGLCQHLQTPCAKTRTEPT